jgi:hypothetical protein
MAIAEMRAVVLDCPSPRRLADFYRELIGWEVDPAHTDGEGWISLTDGSSRISFQQVEDYRPPDWPSSAMPQQFHLDLTVADLDEAEGPTVALGATKAEVQPSEKDDFRVFLDPAGHPFCLCVD